MNIVVLAGGLCPERDVSLSSGCLIANALIDNGHRVLLADVYIGLADVSNFSQAYEKYRKDRYEFKVPESEPDLAHIKASRHGGTSGLIGEGIIEVCSDADITFNALHGDIGENGQLQAVFDIHAIKYTGTGYEGSFLAMDKPLAKELMRYHDILTPDWVLIETEDADSFNTLNGIDLPCVIKPCTCGSSVGVSIVNDPNEFDAAYEYARAYEDRIMAEPKIVGREFSIAILGGEALPPIEIMPIVGFYDYKNKYQPGATNEITPPHNLTIESDNLIRETALKIHKILRLGDYSRIDMILDENGRLYCLEANSLPGMTPTSLMPQEAAVVGITYGELCERIINLALKRYHS
jgi:D-alanine-D-alanine ligase